MSQDNGKRPHEDTSISLHPLTVEEAVRRMLDTPPPPKREEAKEKSRVKRKAKEKS